MVDVEEIRNGVKDALKDLQQSHVGEAAQFGAIPCKITAINPGKLRISLEADIGQLVLERKQALEGLKEGVDAPPVPDEA